MRPLIVLPILAFTLLAVPAAAQNADPYEALKDLSPLERKEAIGKIDNERNARQEAWKAMTPEERQTHQEKMKEKWQNLSPEQKARLRDKREDIRDHHENIRDRIENRVDRKNQGGKKR